MLDDNGKVLLLHAYLTTIIVTAVSGSILEITSVSFGWY